MFARCAVLLSLFAATVSCGGGEATGNTPTNPPPTNTPAAVAAVSSRALNATAGQPVSTRPSVKVTTTTGAAVSGVAVTFAVTSGGGSVQGAAQTTNSAGVATVGAWTLGAAPGPNTLTATVAGLSPVTFTATGILLLSLNPPVAATAPGGSVAFTANATDVVWRVNGMPGGSPEVGVISAAGVYTAPPTIPAGDSVVVSVVRSTDITEQRSSVVVFVPNLVNKDYYIVLPRVVDATSPQPTRVVLVPPANVTSVTFVPLSGSGAALSPIGAGALTFTLGAQALQGYVTGTLRNFVGRLDYRDAAGSQVKLTNFSVNVRDATMPAVTVTQLAADAQRSPYVLNLRLDTVTVYPSGSISSRALQLLGGDLFDFVAVIATVSSNNNRVYIGLRNDITGIGLSVMNNSASWGGAGKLRGAIAFPLDVFFDGAEQGMIHEVGHSWINFATDPLLSAGVPHWPPSSMANGTMGFNLPGTNVGGNFPYSLTSLGNGMVRINTGMASDRFTPLDLYAIGLLPADSVPPMYVLPPSFNVNTITDGLVTPATTYTIAQYVAAHGARVPASNVAPRQFATAVVVLSCGRLLSAAEMAFFDHAAARAETTTPLQSLVGAGVMVTASGFHLATGGRATLRTRLQ